VQQIDGLTVRYQRRTPALQKVIDAVAVALAGQAGARLLTHLHQQLSGTAMLTSLMAVPLPLVPVPRVLGVDLSRSWDYPEARAGPARVRWWRADPGCCGQPRSE